MFRPCYSQRRTVGLRLGDLHFKNSHIACESHRSQQDTVNLCHDRETDHVALRTSDKYKDPLC